MKSKLKLYFGKKPDEVEEILPINEQTFFEQSAVLSNEEIIAAAEDGSQQNISKQGTQGKASAKEVISTQVIPENDEIIESKKLKAGGLDRKTISLVFVDEKEIDKAAKKVVQETKKESKKFVSNITFDDLKFPDVESAFSSIDQTIEEQFQKAREKARKEAGLDEETKQQQRMRIEWEFRERRKKRDEQRKKVEKSAAHAEITSAADGALLMAEVSPSELGEAKPGIGSDPEVKALAMETSDQSEAKALIIEASEEPEATVATVATEADEVAAMALPETETSETACAAPELMAEIVQEPETKTIAEMDPSMDSADTAAQETGIAEKIISKQDLPKQEIPKQDMPEQEIPEMEPVSGQRYPELFEIINDRPLTDEVKGLFVNSYLDKKVDAIVSGIKKGGKGALVAVEKMGAISACGIDGVDLLISKLEARVERRGTSLKRTLFAVEHYFEKRKKQVAFAAAVSIIGMLIITFAIGNFTAYEYMYNGKLLGIVKNQEEVFKTIDVIGDKLVYEHNAEIKIDKKKDITFNRILAGGQDIDDKEDILNRLTYMKDITAKGYAIVINGKQTTILADEDEAKAILQDVKNQFISEGEKSDVEVSFEEAVLIEIVETKLGNIESEEKASAKLMAATTHKAAGEEKALLNIQTEEVITYDEPIPFTIAYEDTMTKYQGETAVKSKGTEGQKQVIAKVVKTNGKEVEREILKESTLSEPVAQIVLRGAKEPPKLVGTGTFIYPIRGTITSRFGYRWGDFHLALDIAAPSGTLIKASDGGTVTYAGWKNSYGNIVEIDHGGNRTTKYAHCSALLVKAGQKVYQGMEIAKVGSTGNSTGPHVHFEVLINGVPKNPLSYL